MKIYVPIKAGVEGIKLKPNVLSSLILWWICHYWCDYMLINLIVRSQNIHSQCFSESDVYSCSEQHETVLLFPWHFLKWLLLSLATGYYVMAKDMDTMDIMARNMPMLLLNLKQILFVQLMLMSQLLKTWKSLKANMKKCYSEKFSIKWLFVCPGRRLMPVLVPFGTPDKQEAPHHPTHHFDLDIWTDLWWQ